MPLQNRVTPDGEIIADTMRGMFMGNRGILHDDHRTLGTSRWKHPHWIICLTEFRGRYREVMTPRRYTELFFLDEAVALAAGHRPCAECRRTEYNRYVDAVSLAFDQIPPRAASLDRMLHQERVTNRRQQKTHQARLSELPDGTLLRLPYNPGQIRLRTNDRLLLWAKDRYFGDGMRTGSKSEDQTVEVLTPPLSVLALKSGYHPVLHPTALSP